MDSKGQEQLQPLLSHVSEVLPFLPLNNQLHHALMQEGACF